MQIGILTVSDRGAEGKYEDESGPLAASLLKKTHPEWTIARQEIIPDDFDSIAATLIRWCAEGVALILTSGGTGFSPRDITPEATRYVIQREAPGIAEALRAESLTITRHAMLSRAVAGIRERTLIINMPGNPKAVRENLEVLMPVLPHALDLLQETPGEESEHRSV